MFGEKKRAIKGLQERVEYYREEAQYWFKQSLRGDRSLRKRIKELEAQREAIEPTWTTNDGRLLRMSEMHTQHLLNLKARLYREGVRPGDAAYSVVSNIKQELRVRGNDE